MAEMKVIQNNLVTKNRENEVRVTEHANTIESYKRQVSEMTNVLKSRDASLAKESSSRREAEIELEKLQVRVDEVTRTLEAERSKGTENNQLEALRVGLRVEIQFQASLLINCLVNCSVSSLQVKMERHSHSILWSRVLQTMC